MIRWLKPIVFLACLVPLALLAWKAYTGNLGANPIEVITHSTGDWTLIFLLVTLSVTPLRKLTGQLWLIRFRRMFGLFSFFYVTLHFLTYIGSTSFSTGTKCSWTSPSGNLLPLVSRALCC